MNMEQLTEKLIRTVEEKTSVKVRLTNTYTESKRLERKLNTLFQLEKYLKEQILKVDKQSSTKSNSCTLQTRNCSIDQTE